MSLKPRSSARISHGVGRLIERQHMEVVSRYSNLPITEHQGRPVKREEIRARWGASLTSGRFGQQFLCAGVVRRFPVETSGTLVRHTCPVRCPDGIRTPTVTHNQPGQGFLD